MTQITQQVDYRTGISRPPTATEDQTDFPIPSIEDPGTPYECPSGSGSSEDHHHLRTPSLSVSPPPLAEHEQDVNSLARALHSSTIGAPRSAAGDGNPNIGNSQIAENGPLSTFAGLTAAIDNVNQEIRNHDAGLAPTSGVSGRPASPRPRSPRARRSSSQSPRHDVSNEEPPQDLFYNNDFQQAYLGTKRLVRDLSSVLSSNTLHQELDSAMRKLHATSVSLANFQHPSTSIVGFVGDTGVGKSSLLNSLLDIPDIVRASNSGGACTCVATEFHYHAQNHFRIEVDVFEDDELLDQLSEMVDSYRQFVLHEAEMDDSEQRSIEERAKIASATINSMFRGRLVGLDFLLSSSKAEIQNTFRSWLLDLKPSIAYNENNELSREDCSALLRELSSEYSSENTPGAWPYIRKIRVFLNAHILSKGLILVDLPGLRDMNAARQHVTERFLRECDEIFVVCRIGRATTDAGINRVFELAEQASLSNVGIICTRSEEINAKESINDWKGQKALHIGQLLDDISTKETELQYAVNELEEYAGYDDLETEDRNYMHEMTISRSTAERRIMELNLQLKSYLVQTRNSFVVEGLGSEYNGRHLGDGDIKVFCVSNALYQENRNGTGDIAHSYLELSGIIEVRRYCISLVSIRQHRAATRYMSDSVPSLLSAVELWVQSGVSSLDAERRAAVRTTVDQLEKRLSEGLLGRSLPAQKISHSMREIFRIKLYESVEQCIPEWSRAARTAANGWSGWNHGTYSAFCRQYGRHVTPAVGRRDWNKEAIECMVGDLQNPWRSLEKHIRKQKDESLASINSLTDWAIEHLENELDDNLPTLNPMRRAIISQQHLLLHEIEKAFEKANEDLRKLHIDGLTGIRTSFIGTMLEASYRACIYDESGRGSDSRRKAIINNTFAREELFHDIMSKLRNRFHAIADTVQDNARVAIDSNLSLIQSTLDLVRDENVALESQRDLEFNKSVNEAVQIANRSLNEIHMTLGI